MRGPIACAAAATALIVGVMPAPAQKATEQYIPIGSSPGVSGLQSYRGTIQSIDSQRGTIGLAGRRGPETATISDRTRMWLDRSRQRKPNIAASFADIKIGDEVEIKYEGQQQGGPPEWIKVRTGN